MTDRTSLTLRNFIGYGLGDFANNFAFAMGALFLLNYYLDVAGISAAAAGTMLLLVRFFDAGMDLVAGRLVDRTNTRWGRFRPYLLLGSVPVMVLSVLVFSVPQGLGDGAKLVYIYITYMALGAAYSLINIPYGALATVMTQDPRERSKLGAFRSFFASGSFVFLAVVLGPKIRAAHGVQSIFTTYTMIFAVLGVVLYVLCFLNTREVVQRRTRHTPIGASLGTLFQNLPLLMLCVITLCMLMAVFSMNASALFFARYVLGDGSLFVWIVVIFLGLGTLIGTLIVPSLVGRIGKKGAFMLGAAVASASYLVLFLTASQSVTVVLVVLTVASVGAMISMTVVWALEADTVEYGEWKTGQRIEGLNYAFFSFTRKVGQAIGGSIPAFLLAGSGYVPNAPTQADSAQWAIRAGMGLAPAIAFAAAFLLMAAYPLSDKRFAGLLAEIRARAAA